MLAVSLLVLDYVLVAPNFIGVFFFGKHTILLALRIHAAGEVELSAGESGVLKKLIAKTCGTFRVRAWELPDPPAA